MWVYLWVTEEWYAYDGDTRLETHLQASAKADFDIHANDLTLTVAAGNRSYSFCNGVPMYKNEPQTFNCYLSQPTPFEQSLSEITSVRVETPEGSMRCERNQASTSEEAAYACEFRQR